MSKMKKLQNLQAGEVDEITMMQARVEILSQQEQHKIESTMELITLLEKLKKAIEASVRDVEKSARQVREYPAEAAQRLRAETEAGIKSCKYAIDEFKDYANAAKDVLSTARHELRGLTWCLVLMNMMISFLASCTGIWFVLKYLN